MNPEHLQLLQAALPYLKWTAIAAAGLYAVAAFGINVIAAKLRQAHGWLAWIPIANLYLLCRIAQSTPLLIVFLLIPLINLLVLSYLGVRIARRLDKSGVLGAMFGLPILGAFVPLLLSAGGHEPELPADARPASMSPFVSASLTAGAMLALLVALGGAYGVAKRMTKDVVPTTDKVVEALPQRVAGTLTEFPIDTEKTNPARPTKVMTESFSAGSTGGVRVRTEQLPPWIPPDALPQIADDATSADYYSGASGKPVSVVSLSLRGAESEALKPPSAKDLAQFGPNAKLTGIDLKSADGTAYRGYKVTSEEEAYYLLQKVASDIAVIISAKDAEVLDVAARLASNVGNGDGLLEYESYRGVFGRLPSAPPQAVLASAMTFTSDDIGYYVNQLTSVAESADSGESRPAQFGELVSLIKNAAPSNASVAQYARSGEETVYLAGVAGYPSASESWMVFQAFPKMAQAALAAASSDRVPVHIRSISVRGIPAYAVDAELGEGASGGAILLRQGGSLVALASSNSSSDRLLSWAESYLAGQ